MTKPHRVDDGVDRVEDGTQQDFYGERPRVAEGLAERNRFLGVAVGRLLGIPVNSDGGLGIGFRGSGDKFSY